MIWSTSAGSIIPGTKQSPDPVWYASLQKHKLHNIILYAVRNNETLVGFLWAANFDMSKMMQIKETLELTTFLISAVIARN